MSSSDGLDNDFLRELAALRDEPADPDQRFIDSSEQTLRAIEAIEAARETARHEAMEQTVRRVTSAAEVKSKKILKKRSFVMDDGIKAHVRKARAKERMRTVSHFLCDACDEVILNPEDGFIVQGNVYVADPSFRGGLIGNAFPDPDDKGMIPAEEVRQTVFCKECLVKALGLEKSYSLKPGAATIRPRR